MSSPRGSIDNAHASRMPAATYTIRSMTWLPDELVCQIFEEAIATLESSVGCLVAIPLVSHQFHRWLVFLLSQISHLEVDARFQLPSYIAREYHLANPKTDPGVCELPQPGCSTTRAIFFSGSEKACDLFISKRVTRDGWLHL